MDRLIFDEKDTLASIPISQIRTGKNIRKKCQDISLLKDSMRDSGLIQPITVINIGPEQYEAIIGLGRLSAAKQLGWKEINCIVRRQGNPEEREIINISENLIRSDLSKSEYARAVYRLEVLMKSTGKVTNKRGPQEKGFSGQRKNFCEEASRKLGCSKSTAALLARIGKLMTENIANALDNSMITFRDAEKLIRLNSEKERDSKLTELLEAKEKRSAENLGAISKEDTGRSIFAAFEKSLQKLSQFINQNPEQSKGYAAQLNSLLKSINLDELLMESKVCQTCKISKPVSKFKKHGIKKTGANSYLHNCLECMRAIRTKTKAEPSDNAEKD